MQNYGDLANDVILQNKFNKNVIIFPKIEAFNERLIFLKHL